MNMYLVFRGISTAVMDRVFPEIFTQVCPSPTDPDHYTFPTIPNEAHEQLDRGSSVTSRKMVEFDLWICILMARSWTVFAICRG